MFGRKFDPLITTPTPCYLCWWCSKQLPAAFTSVEQGGEVRRVHYECRTFAAGFLSARAAPAPSPNCSPTHRSSSVRAPAYTARKAAS